VVFRRAAAVVLFATQVAHAEPKRVVVATSDRALAGALGAALAPSGMDIVEVGDAPPAAINELSTLSRTVAERERARAVVWLLVDGESATLVAYDRDVDRVLVRPLPYAPPLSAARAAETARAARTMLRALKLSDEQERPAPQPQPIQIEDEQSPFAVTNDPRPSPNVSVLAGFGGRYGRLGEDGVVEAQLAAGWRLDGLGGLAMISLSPEASLSSPSFMGSVSDNSFAIAARMPFRIAPRVVVAGLAGPAVHVVRVRGTVGAEEVSALRFDAALRAGASGTYAVTNRIDLGLAVSMDSLLRRQKYEVAGGEVLVMPRLQVSVGLIFSLRVL
jgi:hypothetical protein